MTTAIGVFDSGFGGLTILKKFWEQMPAYDYIYLGDNARAPYGSRSYETVYNYTLQAVKKLFSKGCPLVVLACNTASAKALRTIQQKDLPYLNPQNRVLGIIRPTAEEIAKYTKTKKIGILGTTGTINSNSYPLEIKKLHPEIEVFQQACPMWAAIVENGDADFDGTDAFIKRDIEKLLAQNHQIDTIVMGCTHYPLLEKKIKKYLPKEITLVNQNSIVAQSLNDYLIRHNEIDSILTKNGTTIFYTSENPETFNKTAQIFLNRPIKAQQLPIN